MGTLVQDAAEVASCATAIDAAITSKGGTLVGGGKLRNAVAGINSIPTSSGGLVSYDGTPNKLVFRMTDANQLKITILAEAYRSGENPYIDWGDGTTTVVSSGNRDSLYSTSEENYYTHNYASVGNYEVNVFARVSGTYATKKIAVLNGADFLTEFYGSSEYPFFVNLDNCPYLAKFGYSTEDSQIQSYGAYSCNALSCVPILDEISIRLDGDYSASSSTFGNHFGSTNCFIDLTITGTVTFVGGSRWNPGIGTGIKFLTVPTGEYTLGQYAFAYSSQLAYISGPTKFIFPADCTAMFTSCPKLRAIPDIIDASATTSGLDFTGLNALKKLPTNITANISFSFANATTIEEHYKTSIATFDASGNLVGGMLGNINTCTNSGQTITLNSLMKSYFTATEQSTIEAAMTAKNWTLAW